MKVISKPIFLSPKTYKWLSLKRENPPFRFCVQSRGGFVKHDSFISLDDALQYCFDCCRMEPLFMNYVEIFDMRSGLVFSIENLKQFYRKNFDHDFESEVI